MNTIAETLRLQECDERKKHWKRWGPYLSERAWGTVREDYSPGGTAWDYFPHDHARSRAYRWNEDGLAGICDRHQRICFALALWNRRDPILKERLFGLNGNEGNHGEDVKEYYFYLDSTPTHSYMKFLYKYPHAAFPYAELVEENRRRDKRAPEHELVDTGVFAERRYFDVLVEYAKASPEDILVAITITNHGSESAAIDVLPSVWFRNTWSWGEPGERPELRRASDTAIELAEAKYGRRWLHIDAFTASPQLTSPTLLFTENETDTARVFGWDNGARYSKDAFHRYLIAGELDAVNPQQRGTKAAAHYPLAIPPGESRVVRVRLNDAPPLEDLFGERFDATMAERRREADEFYASIIPAPLTSDQRS